MHILNQCTIKDWHRNIVICLFSLRKMATRQFTNRSLLTKIIHVTAFSNRLIQFFFLWKENSMDYLLLKFHQNLSTNKAVGAIQSSVSCYYLFFGMVISTHEPRSYVATFPRASERVSERAREWMSERAREQNRVERSERCQWAWMARANDASERTSERASDILTHASFRTHLTWQRAGADSLHI